LSTTASIGLKGEIILAIEIIIIITPVSIIGRQIMPTITTKIETKKQTILDIRNLIEEAGGIVIFTAPYSPDLNPIEYAFNLYKKKLKRYRRILNDGHAHLLALTEIGKEDLVTTFAHCFPDCKFDLPNSKSDKVRNALIKDVVNEIAMDM